MRPSSPKPPLRPLGAPIPFSATDFCFASRLVLLLLQCFSLVDMFVIIVLGVPAVLGLLLEEVEAKRKLWVNAVLY